MTATTIELSIEDGVCVAKRMPGQVGIPPEGGTILEALTKMPLADLAETASRIPALRNLVAGIENTKRIFEAFPGAQKVAHCQCNRGMPFGVCRHP